MPGQRQVNGGAANGGQRTNGAPTAPATAPTSQEQPYDDGFGPMPPPTPSARQPGASPAPDPNPASPSAAAAQSLGWTRARGLEIDPDEMGIEGPVDAPSEAVAQAWARPQSIDPEYLGASRFAASPAFTA